LKLFFCVIFIAGLGLTCKPSSFENNDNLLRIGIASDPTTLDPIYSVDLTSQKINSLLFIRLFRFQNNGSIEGELVKKFSFHGNILKLQLNEIETENKFTLKSSDVAYSLNRLKTETGPRKSRYGFIKSVHIISDLELDLELDSNNRQYLGLLTLPPSSIYQESEHRRNGNFKSKGLYFLKKWNKNETIELGLNKPASNNRHKFPENLILQVLNQPSSAIYLFEKGNLDIMKIPYFLMLHPAVKYNEKRIVKGKSVQYIAINHNNPCFDLPFRKALNFAVDRKIIIEKIFESSASEINASVTNEYVDPYTKDRFHYPYNIELAKKNLSASHCYPQILNKNLELRMRADDENKAKGAALAQYFKELGLKISILPMEKTKLYKENGEKKGDLTLLTWYIDYDSIHNFIDPLLASDSFGNGGNRSFYANAKVDDYLRQVRSNPEGNFNPVEIIKLINEEAPLVFLWSIHENYILSKKASLFPELIDIIVK
jgi:peptide/nickel transport system substrate-binding protein